MDHATIGPASIPSPTAYAGPGNLQMSGVFDARSGSAAKHLQAPYGRVPGTTHNLRWTPSTTRGELIAAGSDVWPVSGPWAAASSDGEKTPRGALRERLGGHGHMGEASPS